MYLLGDLGGLGALGLLLRLPPSIVRDTPPAPASLKVAHRRGEKPMARRREACLPLHHTHASRARLLPRPRRPCRACSSDAPAAAGGAGLREVVAKGVWGVWRGRESASPSPPPARVPAFAPLPASSLPTQATSRPATRTRVTDPDPRLTGGLSLSRRDSDEPDPGLGPCHPHARRRDGACGPVRGTPAPNAPRGPARPGSETDTRPRAPSATPSGPACPLLAYPAPAAQASRPRSGPAAQIARGCGRQTRISPLGSCATDSDLASRPAGRPAAGAAAPTFTTCLPARVSDSDPVNDSDLER